MLDINRSRRRKLRGRDSRLKEMLLRMIKESKMLDLKEEMNLKRRRRNKNLSKRELSPQGGNLLTRKLQHLPSMRLLSLKRELNLSEETKSLRDAVKIWKRTTCWQVKKHLPQEVIKLFMDLVVQWL